jgi:Protein of unknown function DUF262/Protein of unknown function (DUF1524)
MPESRGQIGFQQIGLGGILRQYRLAVPPNQREYSWTDKEVTTLFQDFARSISDVDAEYFLGTIVTIPKTPDLLEITDGQQRLATTAILLAQIRNYLKRKGNEDLIAESITNAFLTDIDRERRERVAKLQLNLDDNDYFRSLIAADSPHSTPRPSRMSHYLIWDAFRKANAQITKILSGFDAKDHGDILNKWISFIEHSAQVILLKVSNEANAYKMFETLNDRGLRTSQSDLVKNYLFGQSASRLAEAQQKWALMRGALESLDEEDITVTFLRHALIAVRGFIREQEVYESVQVQARGAQISVAFLGTLETLAQTYAAIFNPEHEKWNSHPDALRRAIQTLNLLNIHPMRPLMLAVAEKFLGQEAAEAYRTLITLGVRLLIASSTRSGSVEQPLAASANEVFTGTLVDAASLKKRLSGIIPADEQFRQAFEVASVSKASLGRYYLRSLEMTVKGEPTPWFIPNDDRQAINLEHVLPIKPDASWMTTFDNETADAHVKRLGNLALLIAKANSDLKSSSFNDKKEIYKTAPYELTSQIATADDWTPAKIIERQKGLAQLAVKTWPI